MHTIHRIHRGCDFVVHIGANTCTIEVDSAPRCIVVTGQTLANFEEIVANTIDKVLLEQWLFLRRPIEPRDNGVSEVYSDGKQAYYVCNRCGVTAPHTGCVECD
jgi:hypothetical protein